MKDSRADRERRLRELYPLGAVPRQDMPRITGHKASSMAAMAQRDQGPPFYRRGKIAVYPIGPLLDWVDELESK